MCGIPKCYFLVWTLRKLHIELIEFDPGYWPNVLLKFELFFKSYMAKLCLDYMSFNSVLYVRSQFWRVKNFLIIHLTTVFAVIIVL